MEGYGRGGYRGGRGGRGGAGRGGGGGRGDGGGRGRGRGGGHQHRPTDQWRVSGQGGTQAPPGEAGSGRGVEPTRPAGSGRGVERTRPADSGWGVEPTRPADPGRGVGPTRPADPGRGVGPTRMEPGESSTSMRGGYGGTGRGAWGKPLFVQPERPSPQPVQGPVIPEIQTLKISEQLPARSPPESTDRVLPVKRPDNGGTSSIRSARLLVNHFPVKFNPESIIGHYDVDIKAEHGRPAKITKANLCMIRKKLFSDDPAHFPMSMTAYDGEKNIFSAVSLPTGKFKVELSEGGDKKSCSYIFSIKLVNELKLGKLKDYLSGNLLSIPRDILQGMDLVMKENPARNMIAVGRSFYPTEFYPENDLGSGITASRGVQHSLKPTSQGLALCLDYSVLAFRKRMAVLDFLREHVRRFDVNNFRRFRRDVENALNGLKVNVTHRITKQKYTVAGLTDRDTRHLSFVVEDPEGGVSKRETLVNYFKEKYGKDIRYMDIPCLDLGKNNRTNYVPMEFCVLAEGQRYPKELLDKNAALMLKGMSLARPEERMKRINDMVQARDGPCGGDITRNFGVEVNKNMTAVVGRVIGPPVLKSGAPNGKVNRFTVDKEKCQWNLVGKSVVEGKAIDRWAVIDFSSNDQYNRLNANRFIPALINRCKNLGIRMEEPLVYQPTGMEVLSNVARIRELLEYVNGQAFKKVRGRLQIVLCVMTKRDFGYNYLKWVSETVIGMLTQCCLSSPASNANDQYLANLALKINAKLGGSNVELIDRLPRFEGEAHVMFVGADVNHPGSRNTTSPSIAAVVATVNWPAANRYAARVRPQDHRKEKILNFGEMCMELIETYARLNKVKPKKIVVFRDGVSEGQFDMVLNEELMDLKRAIQSENYHPTITLIVAQKRHQTRLFPQTRNDGSATGNVFPGTVVDTTVVHPFEFDFYLCSHYGSLGTSKPTHYHVLWDEHGFSSDQLQRLIYNLCFTFARCTKPVSLVPPVYYADLVAYRGRLYHDAMQVQSPASVASSSSSSTTFSWSSSDERFKLHGELENNMFFV